MTRKNAANRDPGRLQKRRFVGPHPFEIGPLPDFYERRDLEHLWSQRKAESIAGKGVNDHVVAIDPFDGIGNPRGKDRSRSATENTDHGLDIRRIHQRSGRVVNGDHLGARLSGVEDARSNRVLAPIATADEPSLRELQREVFAPELELRFADRDDHQRLRRRLRERAKGGRKDCPRPEHLRELIATEPHTAPGTDTHESEIHCATMISNTVYPECALGDRC